MLCKPFPFARQSCCHILSNSLLAFLSFFVILSIRINRVSSSQSSSIVEFWVLVFPLWFFSILCGFTNLGPLLLATHNQVWWSFELWSISPRPHITLGVFSFNRMNFVKPLHESDRLLFESTFQKSWTRFSCMTSRSV